MAFLGTCFPQLVAGVTMIYVLVARKIQFARVLLLLIVAGVGLHISTLWGFSLTSQGIFYGPVR